MLIHKRRIVQAEGTASAKALRQKWAWCISRTSWRSVWLEQKGVGAYKVREVM